MSENEIKQVVVSLSHPDELNPRRRRRTRKFKDDIESQSGGVGEPLAADATASNVQAVVVQKDIPVETPVTAAIQVQPKPVMATTAVVGGGAVVPNTAATAQGVIHIREKKTQSGGTPQPVGGLNAPNAPVPAVNPAAPKIILHKKRLTNAPVAQTMKKPKFVVSSPQPLPPTNSSIVPPLPPSNNDAPKNDSEKGGRGEEGAILKPIGGGGSLPDLKGGFKRRRRFTERRIKIEVKPAVKSRKTRKVLKEHIDKMHVQTIRRLLIKKGLLKPKSTLPPEAMMRSMLHDYYLLKQNE